MSDRVLFFPVRDAPYIRACSPQCKFCTFKYSVRATRGFCIKSFGTLKLHLKAKLSCKHSARHAYAALHFIKGEPVQAVSSHFNCLLQFLPSSSCRLSYPYWFSSFFRPCHSLISELCLLYHISTELACRISCVTGFPLLHSHHVLDTQIRIAA